MAGNFRYTYRWPDLDLAKLIGPEADRSALDHFHALQEDRDRQLEDYLGHLSTGSGKRYASVVIAASNSVHHAAADADYVCDGTADEVQFQSAINDISNSPWGDGKILLLDGLFNFSANATLDFLFICSLEGMGGSAGQTLISATGTYGSAAAILSGLVEARGFEFDTPQGLVTGPLTGIRAERYEDIVCYVGTATNESYAFDPNTQPGWITGCVVTSNHGATNWVGILGKSGLMMTGNYLNTAIGLKTFGTGTINGIQCQGNRFHLCTVNGILTTSNAQDCTFKDNVLTRCGGVGSDAIVADGTRNAFTGNTVRKQTVATRTGLQVVASAVDARVILNDLKNSATTSYADAGTTTFINYDGSANNWNLL